MTQVHISDNCHTVTVEHANADLAYVIEKAQQLWHDTHPPERPLGPATGFSAERDRGLGLGANKQWGGDLSPVRAEGEQP